MALMLLRWGSAGAGR